MLRAAYELPPTEICHALRSVFGLEQVTTEDPGSIALIIDWHEKGMDFVGAFHLASSQHQTSLKTFDRALIKRAKGLSACVVRLP